MDADDLEGHLRKLGFRVETIRDPSNQEYLVILEYEIPSGSLKGRKCDVALLKTGTVPFQVPAAIQTRPHLVQMGTMNTQASPLGEEWQYWSRRYDRVATPKGILVHIATILAEVPG